MKPEPRVSELSKLHDEENYYPGLKSSGNGNHELLEYNCHFDKIAKILGTACSMETKLFTSVLDMEVTSSHRQG